MNAAPPASLLGLGLYPLPEAARLAQLDVRTARRWAEGYEFKIHGQSRFSRGVMPLALDRVGSERDLTFAEMLTLRLVKGFRHAGLGLATIKRVAERASADFGLPMPFVSRRFRTDGRRVFIELKNQAPGNDEPSISPRERLLIEVLTGQHAFADIVDPFLFANVDWQDDIAARWWPLGQVRSVILDPQVMFGAPRINGTSVPTAALAKAARAEGGDDAALNAVADWFGVKAADVSDAVHFETKWLARAA